MAVLEMTVWTRLMGNFSQHKLPLLGRAGTPTLRNLSFQEKVEM